jgi:hypothetical protein
MSPCLKEKKSRYCLLITKTNGNDTRIGFRWTERLKHLFVNILTRSCIQVCWTLTIQYWKSLEQNYQNPTVAPMFDLYKKFSTKHVNPQKNMSQQTAEIQHLMQSMADLAIITPGLLEALGILRFLNTESSYSQLVQQIKSMKLKEFTAASITHLVNGVERPKTAVAAVAGVKRKANFSNGQFPKRRCLECKKPGHDESNCWFKHPEKRPQKYSQNDRRNVPLQARVVHAAEKSQKHQGQQEDGQSDD